MAASHYWNLLGSVSVQLGSASIPASWAPSPLPSVVLRRKLVQMEGDPAPLIILAPGRGGEKIFQTTFKSTSAGGKKNVLWDYPVTVAFVQASNETLTTGLQASLDLRESLRNTLFVVDVGSIVVPAFDMEIDPEEVTDFAAFIGTNYDVTGWAMTYRVTETF